jgi:hypothetical protein
MIKEIVSENDSQTASKPDTPKLLRLNHSTRSLSTDVAVSNDPLKNMMRTSLRDTTPSRKYFDSGDYELAKAGIVSSSSVGSIHPNPEKLVSYSRSSSSHHLQQFIKSFGSRDDFGISADGSVKNQVAPNTNLRRSTVSIASLEEE